MLVRRNRDTHTRSLLSFNKKKRRKWTKCEMCQTKQEPYFNFMRNFPFGLISGVSFNFLNYFSLTIKL